MSEEMQKEPEQTGTAGLNGGEDAAKAETEAKKTESTIFSDPDAEFYVSRHRHHSSRRRHLTRKERKTRKLIIKTVGVILCIALILGAEQIIKRVFPKGEENTSSREVTVGFKITEYSVNDVQQVRIEGNGVTPITYYCETSEDGENSTTNWYIEGVDKGLTSSTSITSAVANVAALSVMREMGADGEYGFDNPYLTATVSPRGEAFAEYTVTVGNESPDRNGRYLKTSLSDKVYFAFNSSIEGFCRKATEFADLQLVSAFTYSEQYKDYFTEEVLTGCDSITLSGGGIEKSITFEKNTDADRYAFILYMMKTPYNRPANSEKMDELLKMLGNGLTAEACLSYGNSDDELEAFGLKNPQTVLTVKIADLTFVLSATQQSDGTFAVTSSGKAGIWKLEKSELPYYNKSPDYFFDEYTISEPLKNYVKLNVKGENINYNFDITYVPNETDDYGTFDVVADGKKIKGSNFQNFYSQFASMKAVSFSTELPRDAGGVALTITATRADGSKMVMEMRKLTDRRYHVSVDGQPMTVISTTVFNSIVRYATAAHEGEVVPGMAGKNTD